MAPRLSQIFLLFVEQFLDASDRVRAISICDSFLFATKVFI